MPLLSINTKYMYCCKIIRGLSGANWIKGVGFTSTEQKDKEKARKGKRGINYSRRKAGC